MKKTACIIFCLLMITGCWDRKELGDIGIVFAIGLDKNADTGKIVTTVQVVRPSALSKQNSGKESSVEIVSSAGDTLIEAFRGIGKEFDRKLYYAHTKVIIISERLAKEGILPLLDALRRGNESRELVWLFIAKNASASHMLGIKHGIDNIQGTYLDKMIVLAQRSNEKVSTVNLLEVAKKLQSGNFNPVLGVMESKQIRTFPVEGKSSPSQGIKLSGTAVFKKDRLVGYLNEQETRGLHWILNKVQGDIIKVPSLIKKNQFVSLEIKRARSIIKPSFHDGHISFTIQIDVQTTLEEQQSPGKDVKVHPDESFLNYIRKLDREQDRLIAKEVEKAIEKVQKKYKSDILGFGMTLNKKLPKVWKTVEKDWETLFPEIDYSIRVNSTTKRTGLIKRSIITEE